MLGASWQVPPPVPVGYAFSAQALALFAPGSLASGQNAAGFATGNAVTGRFGPW